MLQRGRRPSSAETPPLRQSPERWPGGFNVAADRRRRRRRSRRRSPLTATRCFNVAADRRRRRLERQLVRGPAGEPLQRGRRPSSAETLRRARGDRRAPGRASTWPPTVVGGDPDARETVPAGIEVLQRGRRPSSAETQVAGGVRVPGCPRFNVAADRRRRRHRQVGPRVRQERARFNVAADRRRRRRLASNASQFSLLRTSFPSSRSSGCSCVRVVGRSGGKVRAIAPRSTARAGSRSRSAPRCSIEVGRSQRPAGPIRRGRLCDCQGAGRSRAPLDQCTRGRGSRSTRGEGAADKPARRAERGVRSPARPRPTWAARPGSQRAAAPSSRPTSFARRPRLVGLRCPRWRSGGLWRTAPGKRPTSLARPACARHPSRDGRGVSAFDTPSLALGRLRPTGEMGSPFVSRHLRPRSVRGSGRPERWGSRFVSRSLRPRSVKGSGRPER